MATVNPVFGGIANAVKDVGSKLYRYAHAMDSRRTPYPVIRNTNIRVYRHIVPITEDALFLAPNCLAQGNVILGHNVSLMYHTIVRNYHCALPVRIGDNTTILDRTSTMGQVRIGHDCLIGIGCTLDCCDVHDNVHIGHGACIQLGCVIEDGAVIAAGANIEKDTRVGAGELWAGNPGRKVGTVTPEMAAECQHQIHDAIEVAKMHKKAITDLYEDVKELDFDWLVRVCEKIESRQKALSVKPNAAIPVEARRFLQPRVAARRPEKQMRVSYPVNRIAPWMPRPPDWAANV